ncbi:urea amidolyase [uncultured Roseovarius sp.]|uniref:5-oxoprolinase subunit C family protein n=1 Tax=uncultured Roseovarius sp. TaxID=293344 RepID=UPI00260E5E61|nr:urea amidolyase [uncultured Roseovarius sp.]
MTRALIVHRAGPGTSVQDRGRPGFLAQGLSRGGAADRLALAEGAALLRQDSQLAALELVGTGGDFEVTADTRIALTGAPMRATIDGAPIVWNASHLLPQGARLSIGAARTGNYGYLHLGGGLDLPTLLTARSAHLAAGLNGPVQAGSRLPLGPDAKPDQTGLTLGTNERFDGGTVRFVAGPQTPLFDASEIDRFTAMGFRRDTRGNRMGVKLFCDGAGFHSDAGLSVLSEVITPGDIQITGDGSPFVLLGECQTTGGYPRIGSVLPCDLPRVAQARPGDILRFSLIPLAEAVEVERREDTRRKTLRNQLRPLIRDPHNIHDLLSYQLISGVTAGDDLERDIP